MSSPRLRVFLTSEQEKTLFELSKAPKVPQRSKDRASAIRFSRSQTQFETSDRHQDS